MRLKPEDVRNEKISERELKRKKADIRKGKRLNFKTKLNRILLQLYTHVNSQVSLPLSLD